MRGKLEKEKGGKSSDPNGTYIRFTPDHEIFDEYSLARRVHPEHRLRYYAYLNSGLKLVYTPQGEQGRDLLRRKSGLKRPPHRTSSAEARTPLRADRPLQVATSFELAFTHMATPTANRYFSFVNGQYTNDGGTHQTVPSARGLLKGVNEFSKKSYAGEDVRDGIDRLAIAVKLQDPVFESQTKNKLGSARRAGLARATREGPGDCAGSTSIRKKAADRLLEKVEARTRRFGKELSAIKKDAKRAGQESRDSDSEADRLQVPLRLDAKAQALARTRRSSCPRATPPRGVMVPTRDVLHPGDLLACKRQAPQLLMA